MKHFISCSYKAQGECIWSAGVHAPSAMGLHHHRGLWGAVWILCLELIDKNQECDNLGREVFFCFLPGSDICYFLPFPLAWTHRMLCCKGVWEMWLSTVCLGGRWSWFSIHSSLCHREIWAFSRGKVWLLTRTEESQKAKNPEFIQIGNHARFPSSCLILVIPSWDHPHIPVARLGTYLWLTYSVHIYWVIPKCQAPCNGSETWQ